MVKISFIGDVCFNGVFNESLSKDAQIFSSQISDKFKESDFSCCNFEGPETSKVDSQKSGICLKNGEGAIDYLVKNKVTGFNLGNNHMYDYGSEGVDETLAKLNAKNLNYAGVGGSLNEALKPIIIEKGNELIALLAVAEKENPVATPKIQGIALIPSVAKFKKQIADLKEKGYTVIVMYHGGEEYSVFPSPKKRRLLTKLAKKTKLDAIIAHHSHTFQGMEKVNGKPVFYSLGNFVFDLPGHDIFKYTHEGAIVTLEVQDGKISYELTPVYCNTTSGKIENGDSSFIEEFKLRSDFSDYKRKWRKECYRIIFERPEHKTLNPETESLQKKSVLWLPFSRKFYRQIFRILRTWKLRNLYWNAIRFKIMG